MLIKYTNGNYTVSIDDETGTKIRETNDGFFHPTRVESMDVKVTNQCSHGCLFCHENSVPNGKQASIENVKRFAASLPPYTEIALGGGNLMEDTWHTEEILKIFKKASAICSITVHQEDFVKYYGYIGEWIKLGLVHGVGVSLSNVDDIQFWSLYDMTPTAVIHVIAGILSPEEMYKLEQRHARVLILGYKHLRRGETYFRDSNQIINSRINFLKKYLVPWSAKLEVCSFDNLALEQLDVQSKIPENIWNEYYMGDDGITSFYVDLVEWQFAKSSTSTARYDIDYDTVQNMYDVIRGTEMVRRICDDKNQKRSI